MEDETLDQHTELLRLAKEEANEMVTEAKLQAETLLKAAEERRRKTDSEVLEVKEEGRELARSIERSIELLTRILKDLRKQLG